MMLGDVLLDRQVPIAMLRSAIASVFSLPEERVAIVSGMENARELTGVTVDATELGGEFPMQLAIYVADADSLDLVEVAARIVKGLSIRALIPSDSVDPYKMVLIQPDGTVSEVDIDTHSIDELGEYRVVR
jgi:hypothetical protein